MIEPVYELQKNKRRVDLTRREGSSMEPLLAILLFIQLVVVVQSIDWLYHTDMVLLNMVAVS